MDEVTTGLGNDVGVIAVLLIFNEVFSILYGVEIGVLC